MIYWSCVSCCSGFDLIIAYSTSAAWLQAKKREELWWQFTRSLACHSLPIFLSIIRLRHKFDQWIDIKQYTCVSELTLPYLGDRYTWDSSTFWLKDLLRASGEVMLLYWSSKLWLSCLTFMRIIVLGEGIEDILPPKNSWNSGLVVMRIGIALRILDFIVKRVNIFNIQELNMSMEATREHKNYRL